MIEQRIYERINWAVALLIAMVYLFHINQDFWGDELYTLEHFVLVPISTTLTDYHVPNNHIFFNLLSNLYLKVIGVTELGQLLDAPYLIRLFPYSFVLLLLGSLIYYGRKLFSPVIIFLGLILIAGSVPYFNFALQIRGYGLSALLLLISVFESILYFQDGKNKNLYACQLFSILSLYTLLTNLYPIALVCSFWLTFYSLKMIRSGDQESLNKLRRLIVASMLGGILCLLIFLPILKDLLSGEFIKLTTPFLQWQIEFYLPHLKEAVVSGRFALFALYFICLLVLYKKWNDHRLVFLLLTIVAILPPFISYMIGDQAPLRTFVPLFPIAMIAMAIVLQAIFEIRKSRYKDFTLMALLIIYSSFRFYAEMRSINADIAEDIEMGRSRQYLYHQYYNSSYFPLEASKEFKEKAKKDMPLVIIGCRKDGIPQYLEHFGIEHLPYDRSAQSFDSLKANGDSFYIVSSQPNQIAIDSGDQIIQLSTKRSFHTYLEYQNH